MDRQSLCLEKARSVRCIVFDVDGVLTDGRILIDGGAGEWKSFDVRDGLRIVMARKQGMEVAFLTGRESLAVRRRAAEHEQIVDEREDNKESNVDHGKRERRLDPFDVYKHEPHRYADKHRCEKIDSDDEYTKCQDLLYSAFHAEQYNAVHITCQTFSPSFEYFAP